MKRCIRQIWEENRSVRFFWLKAHVGTPDDERVDELAKRQLSLRKRHLIRIKFQRRTSEGRYRRKTYRNRWTAQAIVWCSCTTKRSFFF
ncbi:unnamed protein product [Euphydryas editha]|uniref:RNase H type-1 domain-containing protein n=1 Tax=Euphydryas editha TaxID=104508 RepID=A0AAU9VCE1_EUPED|nr:unnamed protein product [Euphydryas editha]